MPLAATRVVATAVAASLVASAIAQRTPCEANTAARTHRVYLVLHIHIFSHRKQQLRIERNVWFKQLEGRRLKPV
jgi:hypothetical protein